MTFVPFHTSDLLTIAGVQHGFFTRRGGASDGIYASLNCGPGSNDLREKVMENRRRVAALLSEEYTPLLTCYQVHGAEVVTVHEPWEMEAAPKADAMVTTAPGIMLGILTADCVPVLFADSQAGVIGAAHAGWKGARAGVLKATVDAMQKQGAKADRLIAAVGPSIAQASYEVGDDLCDVVLQEHEHNACYFAANEQGRWQFDLKAYVVQKLAESGIGQINLLAKDTFLEEDAFFSYRRTTKRGETDYGRQISAIMLQETKDA